MNVLLKLTAVLEGGTGLALVVSPAQPAALLLGVSLNAGGLVLGRVAGGALVALGVACWLATDGHRQGGREMVAAMLLYNVTTVAVLAHAGLGMGMSAPALWPAVALHTALTLWCVVALRKPVQGAKAGTGSVKESGGR